MSREYTVLAFQSAPGKLAGGNARDMYGWQPLPAVSIRPRQACRGKSCPRKRGRIFYFRAILREHDKIIFPCSRLAGTFFWKIMRNKGVNLGANQRAKPPLLWVRGHITPIGRHRGRRVCRCRDAPFSLARAHPENKNEDCLLLTRTQLAGGASI